MFNATCCLVRNTHLQGQKLISQWLQQPHNSFNGSQLTDNIGQRDLSLSCSFPEVELMVGD
jgi:hypothetical protein